MAVIDVPYDPTLGHAPSVVPYDATTDSRDDTIPGRPTRDEVDSATPKGIALPSGIARALTEYGKMVQNARKLEREYANYQAEYLATIRREAELTQLKAKAETPFNAWCADYSVGLEVGTQIATLEVPGEVDPVIGGGINIKPGTDELAYWRARYGVTQLGPALSPAGFAWNMTMLTPWMKWMPLWRYGIVQSKDEAANTVSVTLNPIVSKVGSYMHKDTSLNEPWASSMTDIPVEYMSCGAAIFEVDDEVIVEFRQEGAGGLSYYEPYVIGFKDHPKMCERVTLIQNNLLSAPVAYFLNASGGASYDVAPDLHLVTGDICVGAIPTPDGWIQTCRKAGQDYVIRRIQADGTLIWQQTWSSFFPMSLAMEPLSGSVATANRSDNTVYYFNAQGGALVNSQAAPVDGDHILNGIGFLPDGTPIYSVIGRTQDFFAYIQVGDVWTPVAYYGFHDNNDRVYGAGYFQGSIWANLEAVRSSDAVRIAKLTADATSVIALYPPWVVMTGSLGYLSMGTGFGVSQ